MVACRVGAHVECGALHPGAAVAPTLVGQTSAAGAWLETEQGESLGSSRGVESTPLGHVLAACGPVGLGGGRPPRLAADAEALTALADSQSRYCAADSHQPATALNGVACGHVRVQHRLVHGRVVGVPEGSVVDGGADGLDEGGGDETTTHVGAGQTCRIEGVGLWPGDGVLEELAPAFGVQGVAAARHRHGLPVVGVCRLTADGTWSVAHSGGTGRETQRLHESIQPVAADAERELKEVPPDLAEDSEHGGLVEFGGMFCGRCGQKGLGLGQNIVGVDKF
mmetsp:Transcript_60800/g.132002  ORF Transcript_60800/g.132002 Transcript_60800/m.132002 type:complete len:281 (-) Transcript_60800:680-1522(-)